MAKILNITSRIETCTECPYFRLKASPLGSKAQCATTEVYLKKPYSIPIDCPLEDAG